VVIRRRTLALLAGIAAAAAAPAARAIDPDRTLSECSVDVWRARDGLPGGWIRGIAQTPDGYLWIGTQGGLSRYGGDALVGMAIDPPLERARDIMGTAGAPDGTIWAIPPRGHPVCVRPGEASVAPCLRAGGPLPADTRIADVSVDEAGAVWIAAPEGVFRHAAGALALVAAPGRWGGAAATAVHHDQRGRLWVGTARGLYVVTRAGDPAAPMTLVEAEPGGAVAGPVAALARGRGDSLWAAVDGALVQITGARAAVLGAGAGGGLPPARLTRLLEDRDGNVWIGSREGLFRYQPGRGFTRFGRDDGLPDHDVSALFEDREGSLWVGTRAGGLAQFSDRTMDRKSGPPGLRNAWVSSVAEDQQGVLWAGTQRGLTRWAGGEERTFTPADGLPGEQVFALHPGAPGELWVGTDRGLARFRGARAEAVPQVTAAVTALHRESDGTLWIGAADGLWRMTGGALRRFPFGDELAAAGVEPGEIRAIQRDDQGTLWLSADGRLLWLDGERLRRPRAPAALAMDKVRAMTRDRDGALWLGTGDGLVRRQAGAWRVFGAAAGLGRADLFQVAADDLGSLWVGVNHGVIRVSRAALARVEQGGARNLDVVSFEVADQRREVRVARTRQPGVWKSRDGWLRFASSRGVVSIDPARVPRNTLPPPVVIERALVDGRAAHRGQHNRFPPGSGALEVHFAAITLLEPRKAQHRYRLEGFEPGWVEAGTRRAAYYTNLPPGRYVFRVQGSNADGVWNQAGDALELTLAPHFYQRHWFYGLGGLCALGLALSIHRLRVARLRTRYGATLAERARVARELHDSLLQGMAATLMHLRGLRKRFAGAGAGAGPPAETVAGEIKDIEQLVADNIEETRRFVWDLRDRAGETAELPPALHELVRRAVPAGAVEARVLVEGDARPVPGHVHRELLRIAHEALTNALKHADARHLEVRLDYQGALLKLSVRDDGRGFDPGSVADARAGHFGLTGMRERAARLGQLAIDSGRGRGTRVEMTVSLKDLADV
jgi:signal transduction histidine kinase